jgi:hypothetical protein
LEPAGGVRTKTLSRTAPQPIFWFVTQSRLDWIVFYIREGVQKVPLVMDVAVEWLTRPKLATAIQDFIAFLRGKTFP